MRLNKFLNMYKSEFFRMQVDLTKVR